MEGGGPLLLIRPMKTISVALILWTAHITPLVALLCSPRTEAVFPSNFFAFCTSSCIFLLHHCFFGSFVPFGGFNRCGCGGV